MCKFAIIVLGLGLLLSGCTSMQRVDTTPEDLQAQIREGKYLSEGKDVTITLIDGNELEFQFARIENDAIVGKTKLGAETSVLIVKVDRLETSRFDVGRTAAVAVGTYAVANVVLYGLVLLAAPIVFL
jgi:hypothetical protein